MLCIVEFVLANVLCWWIELDDLWWTLLWSFVAVWFIPSGWIFLYICLKLWVKNGGSWDAGMLLIRWICACGFGAESASNFVLSPDFVFGCLSLCDGLATLRLLLFVLSPDFPIVIMNIILRILLLFKLAYSFFKTEQSSPSWVLLHVQCPSMHIPFPLQSFWQTSFSLHASP